MNYLNFNKRGRLVTERENYALYFVPGSENRTIPMARLKFSALTETERAVFRHNMSLLQNFEIDGVLTPESFYEDEGFYNIVYESFNGLLLKYYYSKGEKGGQKDIHDVLEIVISIVRSLVHIHDNKMFHGNISPGNILIDPRSKQTKLIGFDFEFLITGEHRDVYHREMLVSYLPYISPEKTGRMNRITDYRTDFYSIGITLYEILSGSPPFLSNDPIEIIHGHIAHTPDSLEENLMMKYGQNFASVMNAILMKLLAKAPEERYQSASGLLDDLLRVAESKREGQKLQDFVPGSSDYSNKIQILQKLYGREEEVQVLQKSLERVTEGAKELILIRGYTGIGKTSLVNEIAGPVAEGKGYYISGKFDQFHKDRPYSAFIQAFRMLAQYMLSESREEIANWKERMRAGLSPNGRIITEMIPELEYIIGPQPQMQEVGAQESINRFYLYLKRFLQIFTDADRPLVLFLDDLQWADTASLNLLKVLLDDTGPGRMLILGVYRDNEVDGSHPLLMTIDEMKNMGVSLKTLPLDELQEVHLEGLIADTLWMSGEEVRPLAKAVYKKTGGNPFFIRELLKRMHDDSILIFTREGGWGWDLKALEKLEASDNIVDLIKNKMYTLPEEILELLKKVSCIGNKFELTMLRDLFDDSLDVLLGKVQRAINEGVLFYSGKYYFFFHDRIQEAAYSMVPPDERERIHYNIGKMVLDGISEEELKEKIFYITYHFNKGESFFVSEKDRIELGRLNLLAGKKAMASTAFDTAAEYFLTGMGLSGDGAWESNYNLIFELTIGYGQCIYIQGKYDEAEELCAALALRCRNSVDLARVYYLWILLLTIGEDYRQARDRGLEILQKLGVKLKKGPSMLDVLKKILAIKFFFFRKGLDAVSRLPKMENREKAEALRIMDSLSQVVVYTSKNLRILLALEATMIIFKYGHDEISAFSFGILSSIFTAGVEDYRSGWNVYKLAREISQKYPFINVGRYHFITGYVNSHWFFHGRENIEHFRKAYPLLLEKGEMEFACHAVNNILDYSLILGRNIDTVYNEYTKFESLFKGRDNDFFITYYNDSMRRYYAYKEMTDSPCSLDMTDMYESERMKSFNDDNHLEQFIYLYNRAKICYFHYEYEKAYHFSKKAYFMKEEMLGTFHYPEYFFFHGLIAAACYPDAEGRDKKKFLAVIKSAESRLKKWSDQCGDNFRHKYLFIAAERARIKNNVRAAIDLYTDAIESARKNGYLQNEGICHERAAMAWHSLGKNDYYSHHIERAYRCFKGWGATAKAGLMEKKFSAVLKGETFNNREKRSSMNMADDLDLSSVIKMIHAISAERDPESLIKRGISLSLKTSGAQRLVVMMEDPERRELYVQGTGVAGKEPEVFQNFPVNGEVVPLSIVNYVSKTGENVIISDASNDEKFKNDPYVSAHGCSSILCSSIKTKGKATAVIYMENNLTTDVFTVPRQKALMVLSSQSAIIMENTRLAKVEKEKAVLDREIEMARGIQSNLLPGGVPRLKEVSLSYKYVPMLGVGGDFCDILWAEEEKKLGLFICDVSGHGVYAAMYASMVKMTLYNWREHIAMPSAVLKNIHAMLGSNIGSNFISAAVCSFDIETGRLTVANAGHPPVAVLRKGERCEFIASKGQIINSLFCNNYSETSVLIEPGDTLLLYTDGVTEAVDEKGVMLGEDEGYFAQWIESLIEEDTGPQEFCARLYRGVVSHRGSEELDDDFTVIALKRCIS